MLYLKINLLINVYSLKHYGLGELWFKICNKSEADLITSTWTVLIKCNQNANIFGKGFCFEPVHEN